MPMDCVNHALHVQRPALQTGVLPHTERQDMINLLLNAGAYIVFAAGNQQKVLLLLCL